MEFSVSFSYTRVRIHHPNSPLLILLLLDCVVIFSSFVWLCGLNVAGFVCIQCFGTNLISFFFVDTCLQLHYACVTLYLLKWQRHPPISQSVSPPALLFHVFALAMATSRVSTWILGFPCQNWQKKILLGSAQKLQEIYRLHQVILWWQY